MLFANIYTHTDLRDIRHPLSLNFFQRLLGGSKAGFGCSEICAQGQANAQVVIFRLSVYNFLDSCCNLGSGLEGLALFKLRRL